MQQTSAPRRRTAVAADAALAGVPGRLEERRSRSHG